MVFIIIVDDEASDSDDSGSLDAVSELDSSSDSDFDNKPTLKNKRVNINVDLYILLISEQLFITIFVLL